MGSQGVNLLSREGLGEWLVEVKTRLYSRRPSRWNGSLFNILFFFQGFINPSFPFLLLSLPFHSFGEMIKKKDNEEVNQIMKKKIAKERKVIPEHKMKNYQRTPPNTSSII